MARGEVARDCRVGEGSTSSGRNSGSSAKRSSKSTSDRTLLESRQGHLSCPRLQLPPLLPAPHTLPRTPAHAHLSTESKVFFRGGGRTFTFLPVPAASLRSGVSPAALPLLPSLLLLPPPPGAGAGAGAGLGGVGGSPRLSRPSPGTRQSEDEPGNLLAWGRDGRETENTGFRLTGAEPRTTNRWMLTAPDIEPWRRPSHTNKQKRQKPPAPPTRTQIRQACRKEGWNRKAGSGLRQSLQAHCALTMVSGPLLLVRSSAGRGGGGLLRAVGAQVSGGGGGAGVAGCPSSSDSGVGGSRAGPGSKGCRAAGPDRPGAPASKEPTGMLAMAAFTFWGALGVGRWALGATKL